jgi:hypothetical protein
MKSNSSHISLMGLVFTGTLAGLALAACNKAPTAQTAGAPAPLSALPLTDAAAAPLTAAPLASALPPAPPVRIALLSDPSQGYAYLDRAYAMGGALGDAPPDYTYDYDGEQPWVWQGDDGSMRVAEATSEGDRYYYYEPGSDSPYLVRDPSYAYGYDNGELVVVYDRYGRRLPPDAVAAEADYAGRFLARGRDIYQAAHRQGREAVARASWQARRDQYYADQTQWTQYQVQDPEWRTYHDQHGQEERAHWADEHYRRESEAAVVAQSLNDAAGAARDLQAARQEQSRIQQGRGRPGGGPGFAGAAPPPLSLPAAPQGASTPGRPGFAQGQGLRPGQPQGGPQALAQAQQAQAAAQAEAQARQRAAALGQSQQAQQQAAALAAQRAAAQQQALAQAQQRAAAMQAQRATQQQSQAQAQQRSAAMQAQRAAQQQAQAQAQQRVAAMQTQRAAQQQSQAQAQQRNAAMQAQRAAQQQAQAQAAARQAQMRVTRTPQPPPTPPATQVRARTAQPQPAAKTTPPPSGERKKTTPASPSRPAPPAD